MKTTVFLFVLILLVQMADAQIIWDGGGDGITWSDAANWSPDGVPTATSHVTIPVGAIVNLTIETSALADTLIVAGTLIVDAESYIEIGSLLRCSGSIDCSTELNSFGKIIVESSTSNVGFTANLVVSDSVICKSGAVLNINNSWNGGGPLICDGYVYINGLWSNTYPVHCSGELNVLGTWGNNSTLINSGTLDIDAWFQNNGTLRNTGNMTATNDFNNSGSLHNTGTLELSGIFSNNDSLVNTGTLSSIFEITNNAPFINQGTTNPQGQFTNNDIFYNTGFLNNRSFFDNLDSLVITNTGRVDLYDGGLLNNNIGKKLINNGIIDAYDGHVFNHGDLINTGAILIDELFDNSIGSFINNGSFSSNNFPQILGGNLSGNGSYEGTDYEINGDLSPGNSPGCNTIDGNLALNGSLNIEVNGTTACTGHDRVSSTMDVNLIGGTVNFSFGYTPTNGDVITFLEAATITNTFSTIIGLPAGWSLAYDEPTAGKVSISYSLSLPVEITEFKGHITGDDVLLVWHTASEQENLGFEVQHSAGDGSWETLSFLPGQGSSTASHSYSFLDEDPLPGSNYYRLRQIDFIGHFQVSKIINLRLEHGRQPHFALQPNPAKLTSTLYLDLPMVGEAELAICDPFGRTLRSYNIHLDGLPIQFDLALHDLSSGIYWVRLDTGNTIKLLKMVVE